MRSELGRMDYRSIFTSASRRPINAISFDREHGTFWGGLSDDGDNYGIAW
jgi:gamma-glutamyltranspeptidase/glutathione hydrolase